MTTGVNFGYVSATIVPFEYGGKAMRLGLNLLVIGAQALPTNIAIAQES